MLMHIDLNGDWKMRRVGESSWINATVPGSVYNDLLAAGVIPEPFFRDNEYLVQQLSGYDYEYQKNFQINEDVFKNDILLLVCEGLDTLSDISINGVHAASTNNMHRTYEFDIKGFLKAGSNSILISFKSPLEYVSGKQKEYSLLDSKDAMTRMFFLRKAHYMCGWDWGPKLPDMGIWRNICIQGHTYGKINDVIIRQDHTITIRREKDTWGESFEFVVNGTGVFAMGANYIPEDNILARCSRERTEKLIKSCVDANFNSIRVWGGGFYPPDYFYDLCDEYGLIVWQDLMFACGVYRMDDEFKESITQEIIDNMKRLRHHASLGLWCGNNEQEWAWAEWGWSNSFSSDLKKDYIRQFEELLPELAKKASPDTFYWLASPSSGGGFNDPNGENYGDMHYWRVWHSKLPYTAYRNIFPRFMSEFGLQSFPGMKTIETFALPEDRNIFSYVMESHQKNGTGNEKILYYIGENYKYPKDFDSLLYASQLIQAEGLRYGVEHWRRNRGRCAGAIYWQLNDCWPVASWSSIDYYGRYKAVHYVAKRFFAPVLASACEEGTKVSLHVTNETTNVITGALKWSLRDAKSNILLESGKSVNVECLSYKEIVELDFSEMLDGMEKKRNTYLEFCLYTGNDIVSNGTVLFVKAKHILLHFIYYE